MQIQFFLIAGLSFVALNAYAADGVSQSPSSGCANCGMTLSVQRAARGTTQVSEVENSYLAPNVSIQVGDTVTWTNNGMEHHTSTSDDGLWDSGDMVPGKSFSHTFSSLGVFAYSCTYHRTMGMKGKITVLPPAPVITSPLAATGAAGLPFYYAIAATNAPTAFSADPLPQGLVVNGNTISGKPAAMGTFSVTISATSASGADTKTLALDVIAATPELDTDGDGFPDALESLTGSSPNDASSTPFGIPSGALVPLSGLKLSFSLDFSGKKGKDSFKVTGAFAVAAQPVFSGSTVAIDFGGIVKQFALDPNGTNKVGNDSVKFTTKAAKDSSLATSFSVSLNKGDFAATLVKIGFDGTTDAKAARKAISLAILFNGTHYQTTQIVSYTSKLNKSGMGK